MTACFCIASDQDFQRKEAQTKLEQALNLVKILMLLYEDDCINDLRVIDSKTYKKFVQTLS